MPGRHIYGVVDNVLNAVLRRIVPGLVKRNGPRRTDYQKTTGAFFCQLSPLMKGVYLRRHLQRGKVSGKETIPLVDDEEMVRNVSCQMLRKRGYTIFAIQSGEAAIAMVAQKEPVFDLVILDMIMPGLNGGGADDRLRQIDSGLKVLLSSGYRLDGQACGILSRGCNGFIQKPFGMNALSAAMREILDAPGDQDGPCRLRTGTA